MALVAGPKETLATLSSSIGISAAILYPTSGVHKGRRAGAVTLQAKAQGVYVIWDGGAADNTCLLLAVGDTMRLEGFEKLTNFRALEAAASGSLLVVPEYIA